MSNKTYKKLYYFNPGHENAILNASPYYTPPANIAAMQRDLQYLPIWYADPEDYVYTNSLASDSFTKFIQNNIKPTAEILVEQDLNESSSFSAHSWGLSPQVIHFFQELTKKTGSAIQSPLWHNEIKELSSRKTAKDCLTQLQNEISEISRDITPQFYEDLDSIENVVKHHPHKLLAKAPYSSSGRGLLWLPIGELTRTERQILHGILRKQGSVSIERALIKRIDFAMEFISHAEGSDFIGYSLFETNNKGAYQGNYLGSQSDIESKITQNIRKDLLEQVKECLSTYLNKKFSQYYQGCIGVDMMVYYDDDSYKLHPCVEINVRDNMGFVALRLYENYLDKDATGHFYIDFCSNENDMYEKHIIMQEKYPLALSDGRFQHGYFSLCPVATQTKYRAYILLD